MFFRQLYDDQLAQASYLVGCQQTGEALVVDPTRDLDQYLALAARERLRIVAVTETHIHADFVSGARELAGRTGARLYLSGAGPAAWQYAYAGTAHATLLRDGDTFAVGRIRVEALHTPGHTPESLSFLVTDTASAGVPMGIFTGDLVFVGDVGRPDLLERAAGVAGAADGSARQLYRSLQRFGTLQEYLQVWPGHGAGSACGRALGAVPQSTVGYERRTNWALETMPEERFVADVLAGQPDPPPYFARMKRVNKVGPAAVGDTPVPAPSDLAALQAELTAGTPIVDTRPADAYAAGHIPGAISIPLGPAFLTWAGWLLPYDRPIALLGDAEQLAAAARRLRLIGLDRVTGSWTAAVLDAWTASGRALATIRRTDAAGLQARLARGDVQVLDVRTTAEHAAGHIAGSLNIPLGHLSGRMGEIPSGRAVAVQCQGGTRSAIGAGLLDARGRADVLDVLGGFGAWQHAGLPVEREAPTPALDAAPVEALAGSDEQQPQAAGRREASATRDLG